MSDILDKIGKTIGDAKNDDTISQFMMIMNLPNNQFDAIYPDFKKSLDGVFGTKSFQQEILKSLETIPIRDIESEKATIEELIKEIKEDDSLSEHKKDLLTTLLERSYLEVFDLFKNPRERVKVKITKIQSSAKIPTYAHPSDAGADVYAVSDVYIGPNETKIVPTGIKVAIPTGYEIQIRPRSGMSLKTPLRIANAPGTIDSDYRGEIGIIMTNIGDTTYEIKKDDKIAQMIISPVPMIDWVEVDELDKTERNEKGFGSSDTQ